MHIHEARTCFESPNVFLANQSARLKGQSSVTRFRSQTKVADTEGHSVSNGDKNNPRDRDQLD